MKSSRARSLVLVAFGLCAGCGIELDELRTASMRAALGATPDLQVTALTGPTSALPSGSFHATATVCNQVAASTISATVSLYFSTDTTITTADTLLGSAPTGVLAGFQCVVLDIPVTAGSATGAWYLGAYVDPSNAVAETIETNNTRVGPRIFVGSKPDYTFTALTLPSAVQPSGSFKASTTVCNVGTTAAAGNVTVNLYLSADAGVSTSNPVAGSTSLPLAAGQCTSMDVSGTASGSAGAWYSSTIADPGSAISELNESNNSQSGAQLRVGSSPDFTITAATSPSGASSGSSVTTNITACNIGTTSGSASVSVYLSTDTTITTVDIMAGNATTPMLNPGQCAPMSIPTSINPASGAYYAGAIADPFNSLVELNEANNSLAGTRIFIGNKPDLALTAVSGPAAFVSGGSMTTTLTACNSGTSGSNAATAEVYLSTDTAITAADTLVGSASVPALNPGQCTPVNVTGPASVADGRWYVGGWIDRPGLVTELNESNQTLLGNTVLVGSGPDLTVVAISSPSSASASFAASATVCNSGTAGSASASVALYLSSDAAITGSDWPAGTASVPALAASQCATVSFTAAAAAPTGLYTVGAIVDLTNSLPEVGEANNAFAGAAIAIGNGPDLVVSSISGPASVIPGGSFTATAVVCNQGTLSSPSTGVDLYLSADATMTSADSMAGNIPVPSLSAGACATVSFNAWAGVPNNGQWYLGGIVDNWNGITELNEGNNSKAGTLMGVGNNPDLIVSSVTGPASAIPGGNFTATAVICNQGTTMSSGTGVDIYLSADSTITSGDSMSGNAPVPSLSAGACATISINAWTGVPNNGLWNLGAIVDSWNGVTELNEGNNSASGTLMGVGNNPDLIVSSITAPPSVIPGGNFTATAVICNQGTTISSGTGVDVYFSTDTTITSTDSMAGNAPVPGLSPGACATVSVNAWAGVPNNGLWYAGAVVDGWNGVTELNEGNNSKAAAALTGVGNNPDLIVSSISGPPSVIPGGNFTATAVVCNQGTTSSPSTGVDLYLSADTTITSIDSMAGNIPVPSLSAGACATVSFNAWAGVPNNGLWYLGGIVDNWNGIIELNEGNNSKAGTLMGVGNNPDLIVSSITGPASVIPGGNFTATAVICNQGTTMSSGTGVDVYLSADTAITTTDWMAGNAPVPSLSPGACTTVSVNAWVGVPSNGLWNLGAIVDGWNGVTELNEGNNTKAGALMGVGNNPDLIVSSITGPASVIPGGNFTATAVVCNQGTTTSSGNGVDVYLSSDTTITTTDWMAGNVPVPSLAPGACATIPVNAWASVPSNGQWNLGAIVDGWNGIIELNEGNNSLAGATIAVGNGPDLIVSSITGPASVIPGGNFTATAMVCNQGTMPSPSTGVDIYLSSDTAITTTDWMAGSAPVPGLAPGACATVPVNAWASVPGNGLWYLGAIADGWNGIIELNEGNNAKAGALMGVGNNPDLIVSSISGPANVTPGGSFTATAVVCNQGTTMSSSTGVDVYLSSDTTITTTDWMAGNAPVPSLSPGSCVTVPVSAWASVPNGLWTLGAIADGWNGIIEINEGNNAKAGNTVNVH